MFKRVCVCACVCVCFCVSSCLVSWAIFSAGNQCQSTSCSKLACVTRQPATEKCQCWKPAPKRTLLYICVALVSSTGNTVCVAWALCTVIVFSGKYLMLVIGGFIRWKCVLYNDREICSLSYSKYYLTSVLYKVTQTVAIYEVRFALVKFNWLWLC